MEEKKIVLKSQRLSKHKIQSNSANKKCYISIFSWHHLNQNKTKKKQRDDHKKEKI